MSAMAKTRWLHRDLWSSRPAQQLLGKRQRQRYQLISSMSTWERKRAVIVRATTATAAAAVAAANGVVMTMYRLQTSSCWPCCCLNVR